MELPIQPSQWINRLTQSFFAPFLQPANLVEETSVMMPLVEVKVILNQHYINQKNVQLVFEFYDRQQQLQVADLTLRVASPILSDHTVEFEYDNHRINLQLEQILSVNADSYKQSA